MAEEGGEKKEYNNKVIGVKKWKKKEGKKEEVLNTIMTKMKKWQW